jgi:putative adenylate-forming enzyme
MNPIELGILVFHFVRTRWGLRFRDRTQLEAAQRTRIAHFLARELPRVRYYREWTGKPLDQLPIIDKSVALANFDKLNAAGITLADATEVALAGETSRDFKSSLDGITVGLSSGTQGPRGVFLAAPRERAKWAGIMLARVLPAEMQRPLLFGRAPIRVAFFLRANSNLYTTLKSRRIDFRFYDLFLGVDPHLAPLAVHQPDILVAPSRILGKLAQLVLDGELAIAPRRVIAVAEVLEPDDKLRIEQAFGLPVHQLYQCTEGFLGYTCERGTLHLNEEFVYIEKEWIDAEKTRFVPVVTDFSRNTQLIVRYRLNDILRVRAAPCGCGRASLALEGIDGRSDDIVHFMREDGGGHAEVYPDMVRHAIASAAASLPDYRIVQKGATVMVAVADERPASYEGLTAALGGLCVRLGLAPPAFVRMAFAETEPHAKRRRIVCLERPA